MPTPAQIRTLAFVGHGGAGKTTLIESLLKKTGTIAEAGSVERGTTVCDYEPLEKEHQHSMKLAAAHIEHQGTRIHLLDTPGANGLFNVGTGRARSDLDLAHAVCDAAGRSRAVEFINMPANLRGQYQSFTEASPARLRAASSGKLIMMSAPLI